VFINKLIAERDKMNTEVKPTRDNKEYHRLTSALSREKKRLLKIKREEGLVHFSQKMKKCKRSIIMRRNRLPTVEHNPDFVRFDYVRYADD
jgi:hypothetical protein